MSTGLEPQADEFLSKAPFLTSQERYQLSAQYSLAVSMKRIADALTKHPGPRNLYDMMNDICHNTMPVSR